MAHQKPQEEFCWNLVNTDIDYNEQRNKPLRFKWNCLSPSYMSPSLPNKKENKGTKKEGKAKKNVLAISSKLFWLTYS